MGAEDKFWNQDLAKYLRLKKENRNFTYEDLHVLKCACFFRLANYYFPKLLKIKNSKILELGCGTAIALDYLNKNGADCTGVDYSSAAIRVAEEISREKETKIKLIQKDMFGFETDNKFDIVFNSGVFEHFSIDKQEELLDKMISLSNRYVCVIVPNFTKDYKSFHNLMKKRGTYYGVEEKEPDILKLAKKFSLRLVDVDGLCSFFEGEDIKNYPLFKKWALKIRKSIIKKYDIKDFPYTVYNSGQVKLLAKIEENFSKKDRLRYSFLTVYLFEKNN